MLVVAAGRRTGRPACRTSQAAGRSHSLELDEARGRHTAPIRLQAGTVGGLGEIRAGAAASGQSQG